MNRLREYRERYGLTQPEAVAEIRRRAVARGDIVEPGLDRPALSKHENGHKRPGPYYRALYCEVYGATSAELGFCVALPGESGHHEDVDRREFLTGAAGFVAEATLARLPAPSPRLGHADIDRLRRSLIHLYELDDQHGGGGTALTMRIFHRLRGLTERAGYDAATGQALRELTGETAQHAGWLAYDAEQHEDARRWWLEALQWSRLANADSASAVSMVSMARLASDQRRPREAIDLATTAQRTAMTAATPRLTSVFLAREALGHGGARDATSAHAALRRARGLAETRHDDDPSWLDFYGLADCASHECHVALMLGDAAAADDAARTALALGDPAAYPRNHALDLINLAYVLVQRREIDESAAVATQAADAAAGLESARVTRGLHAVARSLAPYRGEPAVGEFLARV